MASSIGFPADLPQSASGACAKSVHRSFRCQLSSLAPGSSAALFGIALSSVVHPLSSKVPVSRLLRSPFGQTTASFSAAPAAVADTVIARVSGSLAGVVKTASVKPLIVASGLEGAVSKLEIVPATVRVGTTAAGTVTLARQAGPTGITVSLTSDTSTAAGVDLFVSVPANQTSAIFSIRTSPVVSPRTVTITAATGDTSARAVLNVDGNAAQSIYKMFTGILRGLPYNYNQGASRTTPKTESILVQLAIRAGVG